MSAEFLANSSDGRRLSENRKSDKQTREHECMPNGVESANDRLFGKDPRFNASLHVSRSTNSPFRTGFTVKLPQRGGARHLRVVALIFRSGLTLTRLG